MPITVESAEKSQDPGSGSALSSLMSIRKLSDVPSWVWYIGAGLVLMVLLNRKESKPDILPAGDLPLEV